MNLEQLRYLVAVAENACSASAAARRLGCSQPAISRQIQLLERELGFSLFDRAGRSYTRATREGQRVIERAAAVLQQAQAMRRLVDAHRSRDVGTLAIATTHTQARYVLPEVVTRYRAKFPAVQLRLHTGTTEQIERLVEADRAELAIASGEPGDPRATVRLPYYRWAFRVVVPHGHPLALARRLTLAALAEHPLIVYSFSLGGRASLFATFEAAGLTARLALAASDADVIKQYVRLGLGVGIVAAMAVDPATDADLVWLDTSGLFESRLTWIGFRRDAPLRAFDYDFIETCAPHLPRALVEEARRIDDPAELEHALADVHLPFHG